MEGIGCEVSHKIRAAIKAKLIELGAYVDDELPDYIMVMVANKRTRTQMDEDLQLFLSSNTKIFTTWLHTVLQKLQEVTVASFEGKKDSEDKKSIKRKKSEDRSKKSSEEPPDKVKKHAKKHKEGRKSKKKHKNKDKGKRGEGKGKDEKKTSQDEDKKSKTKKLQLNEALGRAILGNLKNKKGTSEENDSSSGQSSSEEDESHMGKDAEKNDKEKGAGCNDYDVLNIKLDDEPGGMEMNGNKSNKKEPMEDEFNIEPLKPTEKEESMNLFAQENAASTEVGSVQVEKTISAPTQELLKEHDKIQSQQLGGEETAAEKKKPQSDSEESLSPEEIRKQLLLSRAKKKLEESKKADRMRSNSPDVLIVTETGKPKDLLPAPSRQTETTVSRTYQADFSKEFKTSSPRRRRYSPSVSSNRRSHSSDRSPYRKESKTKPTEPRSSNDDRRRASLPKREKKSPVEDQKGAGTSKEKKKNVIRISESLELERNMGVRKESDGHSKEKESSSRRKTVSSRVVTVVGPEEPEIPSIVKVKPREFVPKEKQANKTLLLKAVADAEKSIAAVQPRMEIEPPAKKEALYTKNLREKRYGKLAITVSNIRQSPDSRDRMLSVNSEKSDKSRPKHASSDVSDGLRNKPDLLSRKIVKSEDQFISSKTSVMENNEKYIRCWLEGVEKAVQEDEMVNPNEMEDFVHSSFSDEENGLEKEEKSNKKRNFPEASTKVAVTDEKPCERAAGNSEEKTETEPQIVVTLDGLDSKTLEDLILKNKDAVSRQMLSVDREKGPREKEGKGFEKINDRFGRLNKVAEDLLGKGNKKSETDKKEKTSSESKNRQLIAQLSEKFGKVDREFENRKRKRPDDDRRYSYGSRRGGEEDSGDRNGRYRRSIREGGFRLYRRS